ncbi:MAG: C69 family dipeptidase [Candidatus Delongbacteria bacterium]|nr:C69 family dipeptidase [Candidatus Delongbacteria bacterium]
MSGWIGLVVAVVMIRYQIGSACTNFLITRGASADGSTMITYAADSHELYGELYYTPAGRHLPNTWMDIYEWDTGKYLGKIRQVEETYSVIGNMNEHQVAIGETTWGGRHELKDTTAVLDYGSLMYIALQRSKSAREAIDCMIRLVADYGYASEGESFSISDPQEVWIMEMISKGPDRKGAVWVARRIPEGYICGHANQARIHRFPLNDHENCRYAPDVIQLARDKGYFKGNDEEFSFSEAYAPADFSALRACEARVWQMFNRSAPSLKLPTEYIMGNPKGEPLPLWIKSDRKLSLRDVMELMRDHFEDSPMDMSLDAGGGPFGLPYRYRPLTWKVDSVEYFNERATSTQQTGFSFVAQSRSWLPNPIGGVFWFGVDDTYSTVYVPIYCGNRSVPKPFAVGTGSFHRFSWESAFWVFNVVANYLYGGRYWDMMKDVQIVQRRLEDGFIAEQAEVDQAALYWYKQSPRLAREYLEDYSAQQAELTLQCWKKLGESLIVKYLDGNVKNEKGEVTHPPYPETWYRQIIQQTGDKLRVKPIE